MENIRESIFADGEVIDSASDTGILNDTITLWQPLMGRELTREDARQIRTNVTGFFRLLAKWDSELVVIDTRRAYAQDSERPANAVAPACRE
jgi:hypothetical protein